MSIEQLDASGKYVATDASQFLYVRPEEVAQWLLDGEVCRMAVLEAAPPGMGSHRVATQGRDLTGPAIDVRSRDELSVTTPSSGGI